MSQVKEIKDALLKQIKTINDGENDEVCMLNIEKAKATCMIVNTLCNTAKTEMALANFNKINGGLPLNKSLSIEG
jgi:hypothetical protein